MNLKHAILNDVLSQEPKKPLYHYTTQTGLLGIIKDRQIRATHTQYLNDRREFLHAMALVGREIERLLSEQNTGPGEASATRTEALNRMHGATLLFFGQLINRDPELAEQLKSARPELQTALEYAKAGRERSMMFGPGGQARNMQSANPEAETRMDALRFSHINAEAAIAKAEQLPDDDKRASTLLEVARDRWRLSGTRGGISG